MLEDPTAPAPEEVPAPPKESVSEIVKREAASAGGVIATILIVFGLISVPVFIDTDDGRHFWESASEFFSQRGGDASYKSISVSPGKYAREYASRYGNVLECGRIPNGSYFGFPDGADIVTYQLTVIREGSSRAGSMVIALEASGDSWSVVKRTIN